MKLIGKILLNCLALTVIHCLSEGLEPEASIGPPCESEIYCHGKLLDTIQMSRIFNDSKHFVDMKMKSSPAETLTKFSTFMKNHNETPSIANITAWVKENFEEPGNEFEKWKPQDHKQNPKILEKVKDQVFKKWAGDLNNIWLDLGRKMKRDVMENQDKYSIIYVENGVIVPGGRFREFYYWDSYWIIKGLLHSEMYSTAKGMLENFLSIIERFGFIPNGGRVYYSMRSQLPMLSAMIKLYVDVTNDTEFAKAAVKTLDSEYNYWMTNHTVLVKGYVLARYGDRSYGPRPESYREDMATAEALPTEVAKQEYFSELKAAAESGMDFSSRWFISSNGSNKGDLTNIKARWIIPVELNAVLHWNAKIIGEFYGLLGNDMKVKEYAKLADDFMKGVNEFLWNEEAGVWLDYDLINNKSRPYFVPTNLSPLWTKCYHANKTKDIADKIVAYIAKEKLDSFPGGVPNTLEPTGEQWDYPNVWPCMQHILIVGLNNLGDNRTEQLAMKWAEKWVQSNFVAYNETNAMFEKYDADKVGGHGGGGEYEIQMGFGWTNGVILDLLDMYGDTLKPLADEKGKSTRISTTFNAFATSLIAIFATVLIKMSW